VRRLWPYALALLTASYGAAQDKPDFSGHWILVSPDDSAPTVARELTVRHSKPSSNTIRLEKITIGRKLDTGSHSEDYEIGIVRGVVAGIVGSEAPEHRSTWSATWDGTTLVIRRGT
jgi:hypothetical protein